MEPVRTYKTEKGIVEMYYDDAPESPREWDNVVKLHTSKGCPFFDNESQFETYEDLISFYGVERSGYDWHAMNRDAQTLCDAAAKVGDIVRPISVYSHTGDHIYMGTPAGHFDGRWDCSLLGFGIISAETIKNEWGGDYARALECFEGEIKTLSDYVSGEVFWFSLKDAETGEELDSCGGFYGSDPEENGMSDYVGKEVA